MTTRNRQKQLRRRHKRDKARKLFIKQQTEFMASLIQATIRASTEVKTFSEKMIVGVERLESAVERIMASDGAVIYDRNEQLKKRIGLFCPEGVTVRIIEGEEAIFDDA